MAFTCTIMLLGSGELGREFTIAAKRLGAYVIACDAYDHAPAMQMADAKEVFSMLDGEALRRAVEKHRPDHIVPEIEAIRTEILAELEEEGYHIVPTARATQMTMNRDAIRALAAEELGLMTSRYAYAESLEEVGAAAQVTGFPLVMKPVMSSSGKGQRKIDMPEDLTAGWEYACANMRGDRRRVICEEFIDFDYEITLLTISAVDGLHFCAPIGHRQERGDYQESWQPAAMSQKALQKARQMARKIVEELGGYGLFGVEFFVRGEEVIFSELSPRPHDTGMVTLIGQNPDEFALHARAIMGLPIGPISMSVKASASAVILAEENSDKVAYHGLDNALATYVHHDAGERVDIRIFGKPATRPYRRMGVALASAETENKARELARKTARTVKVSYF